VSYEFSGANTKTASGVNADGGAATNASVGVNITVFNQRMWTGLTPGVTTITAKVRGLSEGSYTFNQFNLTATPVS
jgi:hypothetical protein